MKDQIIYLLDIYGYEKREYDYVRDNPKGTSQAITLFGISDVSIEVQMFGWNTNQPDYDQVNIYDTGTIVVLPAEFAVLIEVFDQYKNIDG